MYKQHNSSAQDTKVISAICMGFIKYLYILELLINVFLLVKSGLQNNCLAKQLFIGFGLFLKLIHIFHWMPF